MKPRRGGVADLRSLRRRALALLLMLTSGLAAMAAVVPVEQPTTPALRPLVLRDGPERAADALDRNDARALLAATWAANLAGRYGRPEILPATSYRAGDGENRPVIYASTDPRTAVPDALLADVAAGRIDMLWSGPTIRQLHRYLEDRGRRPGWRDQGEASGYGIVAYHGAALPRPDPSQPLLQLAVESTSSAVLASATTPDGRRTVWALRHDRLTLVAETPLSGDRPDYGTAYADLVSELLAPGAAPSHLALVRIEDVSPATDPQALSSVLAVLEQRHVPASIAVIPVYSGPDPARPGQSGPPVQVTLGQRPELVAVLRRASEEGDTMVLHGVTHQWRSDPNPTSGRTGDDYEFVRAVKTEAGAIRYTGPVPEQDDAWLARRFSEAQGSLSEAGLGLPQLFEFPHYAAAPLAYQAVTSRFGGRYERSLYFVDDDHPRFDDGWYLAQAFPYATVDHYGSLVVPENLGFVTSPGVTPPATADDLIAGARNLLAADQSTASFFFHPGLDPSELARAIDGITALGYRFASPSEVAATVPATAPGS
ncbi:MAG: DUF2334 domain-containing protein [Acidimicrobiales bacterium]